MSLLLIFPKPWCCRTKSRGHLLQHQQFCAFRNYDSGCSNASRESSRQREWSGVVEPGIGLPDPHLWKCRGAGCCWVCSGTSLLSVSWAGLAFPPAPEVLCSRARSHLPNAHYLETAVNPSVLLIPSQYLNVCGSQRGGR